MNKKTTAQNKKVKKENSFQKVEDKDIHLNVVGIPVNNVSVKKTGPGQSNEDYHLYKISIDTTKKSREMERKRRLEPLQTPQTRIKLQQQSKNRPPSLDSSTLIAGVVSHSSPVDHRRTSPPGLRHREEDADSDICFTLPEEETQRVRIVGEPLRKRKSVLSNSKLSVYSSDPKQVEFDELDTVYGSVTSEFNRENFPYRRSSTDIYQSNNDTFNDPFLNVPIKISNVFSQWDPKLGEDGVSITKHPSSVKETENDKQPLKNTVSIHSAPQSLKAMVTGAPNDVGSDYIGSVSGTQPSTSGNENIFNYGVEKGLDRITTDKPNQKKESIESGPSVASEEQPRQDLWRGRPLFEDSISSISSNLGSPGLNAVLPSESGGTESYTTSKLHPLSEKRVPREQDVLPQYSQGGTEKSINQPFSLHDLPRHTNTAEIHSPSKTASNVPPSPSTSKGSEHKGILLNSSKERVLTPIAETIFDQDTRKQASLIEIPTESVQEKFMSSNSSYPKQQYVISEPPKAQDKSLRSHDELMKKISLGERYTMPMITERNFYDQPTQLRGSTYPVPGEQIKTVHSKLEAVQSKPQNSSVLDIHKSAFPEGNVSPLSVHASTLPKISGTTDQRKPHETVQQGFVDDTGNKNNSPTSFISVQPDLPNMFYNENIQKSKLQLNAQQTSKEGEKKEEKNLELVASRYKKPTTIDKEIMTDKYSDSSKSTIKSSKLKPSQQRLSLPKGSKESNKNEPLDHEKKLKIKKSSIVSSIPSPIFKLKQLARSTSQRKQRPEVLPMKLNETVTTQCPIQSTVLGNNRSQKSNVKSEKVPPAFLKSEIPSMVSVQSRRPADEDENSIHSYQFAKNLQNVPISGPSIEIAHRIYEEDKISGKPNEKREDKLTSTKPIHENNAGYDSNLELLDKIGQESKITMESIDSNKLKMPSASSKMIPSERHAYKDTGTSELELDSRRAEYVIEPSQREIYNTMTSINNQESPVLFNESQLDAYLDTKSYPSDQSLSSARGEKHMRSAPAIEPIQEEETTDGTEQHATNQSIIPLQVSATSQLNVPTISNCDMYHGEKSRLLDNDTEVNRSNLRLNKDDIYAYPGHVEGKTPFEYNQYRQENGGSTDTRTNPSESSQQMTRSEGLQMVNENMTDSVQQPSTDGYLEQSDTAEKPKMSSVIVDHQNSFVTQYSTALPKPVDEVITSEKVPNQEHEYNTEKRPVKRKSPIQRDTEQDELAFAPNRPDRRINTPSPAQQMIYVGKLPNTTYNVFFAPDSPQIPQTEDSITSQDSEPNAKAFKKSSNKLLESKSSKLSFNRPKGMIIFVSKKQRLPEDPFEKKVHTKKKSRKRTYASTLRSKDSPGWYEENPHNVTDQEFNIQSPAIQAGGDKGLLVEESPSGNEITRRYPCGCLRIITKGADQKIHNEELISAFCKDGSLCEVRHPELHRYSPVSEFSRPDSRKIEPFPKIELIAEGTISGNRMSELKPASTKRGANFTGTLNIKSDRFNGIFHFYIDPRLKRYLRNNMDELMAFLDNGDTSN